MDLPAVFSNQFTLVVNPITTRITFGDEPMTGVQPVIHTAIVLKTSDAKQLGQLLLKLIEQNEDTVLTSKLLAEDK